MSNAETDVRMFASTYGHLPNVARLLELCESGRVTWEAAHTLARRAMATGLATVQAERS